MDANTVTQIVSSVGFPIAMCLIMAYYVNKQGEEHKEEINAMKESIDGNTKVITELNTMMTMIWEALKKEE